MHIEILDKHPNDWESIAVMIKGCFFAVFKIKFITISYTFLLLQTLDATKSGPHSILTILTTLHARLAMSTCVVVFFNLIYLERLKPLFLTNVANRLSTL